MLGVMERKGLIKRVAVSHDARLKRLVLTDKAAALLDGAERDIREMEARLTAGLSAEDVEHLKRCLDQMLQNLDVTIAEDTRCCCKPKRQKVTKFRDEFCSKGKITTESRNTH